MVPNFSDFMPQTQPNDKIGLTDNLMGEIGRILQAAVINKTFRENLLGNPLNSIQSGYFGEYFHLPEELLKDIACIKCNTIESFTNEVLRIVDGISIKELAKVPVF